MHGEPVPLVFRPFTAAILLGLLGAVVFPFAVSGLWQATELTTRGISLVATVLSLAAIGYSLVFCWRAMTFEEENERIQTLLEEIDSTDE
jgi:hypothetical protein